MFEALLGAFAGFLAGYITSGIYRERQIWRAMREIEDHVIYLQDYMEEIPEEEIH